MSYVVVHRYVEQDLSDLKKNLCADCADCQMSERTNSLEGTEEYLCKAALYDTETLACFVPRDYAPKRKAMISQPMAGKTDDEIVRTREKALADLETRGFSTINTLFTDEWYSSDQMEQRGVVQIPLCFLAKSLENMSLCHVAYFCKGWENARGCRIEHEAAKAYGLEIIYEE